ncbi:hypothetical protein JVU11DRAFT_8576 [Chiua virens]|nr:hypothetical protein JVU11DRAFT_8576 [Chiua virens]
MSSTVPHLRCDPTNTHLDSDIPIVEAGSRPGNPVHTIICFPAQIYGVGQGENAFFGFVMRDKSDTKEFSRRPKDDGMVSQLVKDCAMALFLTLEAPLEGRADEGPGGPCKTVPLCMT